MKRNIGKHRTTKATQLLCFREVRLRRNSPDWNLNQDNYCIQPVPML